MMKQNYLKSLFLMLMMCIGMGAWAEEVTKTFSFGTNVPNGWTINAATAAVSSYAKMKNGENVETNNITAIIPEGSALTSAIKANVSCGTFGTWKGNKEVTITVSLLDADLNVLKTGSYKKESLGNNENTYVATDYPITVDLPEDPSQISKIQVSFAIPNENDVLRFKNLKLKYSISSSSEETDEDALTTMDGIYAKAKEVNGTATDVRVTFNNWVVSGLNGTKNAYLTDGTKGLIIFDSGGTHGFEAGDILNGTVTCKVQLYNGSAELTSLTSTTEGLSVTKGGSVAEQNIAIADLTGINTGALLSYENLTYHLNGTNAEFSDGENVIVAYKGIMNTLPELVEGKAYDVKGIFLMYGEKKEILPRSAEDIVLKEVINSYIVTFDATENGTIVVKDGETVVNEGDEVAEGTELTIECTPTSEDYRFKNWQYKEGEGSWNTRYTASQNYTMPSTNVQFRANFEKIPTYAISWSVNGTVVKTENLKEGAAVSAPVVEAINGKVFTGWVDTETVAADSTPSYVTPTSADKEATYYAVFASVEGEGTNGTIELSNSDIENIYDGKNLSYREGTIGEWSFKGIINKASSGSYFVQMNRETSNTKNAYNSHLSTPTCPAPISSIIIKTTNATASGRTFILTNSAEVGAATTDGEGVYGYGKTTEVAGSVKIDVTGNPTSLHIYPYGGAVYISSVTINYGEPAIYSDFTTTVSAPTTKYNITISEDIENGTVTVDKETAAEGETVTLTITPEDEYALVQLMVYTDYDDVEVEGNTFVMPASDVEVYAYFAPAASDTYTLSELAEADIEPYSVVSVSFDNEIVDIQMDEEEGGYIALKDGDNTFVLQTYYACNAEWIVGGTLSGTWENVYYAEQGGAYILMNDSDEPWAGLTYTTPAAPVNSTLAFKATNDDGYWATFSCDKDVIFDASDVMVYTVAVDNNQIVMIDANDNSLSCVTDKTKDEGWVAGYYVQAGAAVLINSVDESVNYYFIDTDPFISNDLNEVETDPEYNMLVPCTSDGIFKAEADGNMYYKLAYGDNTNKTKLGFWWGAENGSGNFKVKAGGAVLCVPQASGVKGFSFDMAKDEDAIKGVEQKTLDTVIYDMQGRKVSKTQKGLYIVNGRKMVK